MGDRRYRNYFLLTIVGVLAASFYPIYMGIRVVVEMSQNGFVPLENYPKYIIPYTPITIAVIMSVLFMPLIQKLTNKLDLLCGMVLALVAFFIAERIFETGVLVQTSELVPLESWQMSLCYVPPEEYQTRTWEAVDVLLGGYSPAFKLHFYLISVVIIISLLNCLYGFAKMIHSGDYSRKKVLIIQSVASLAFLGMCIWACFTAFYRTGEITVSPVSALLMSVFFIIMGVTVGVFVGSFLLGKGRKLSIILPAVTAIFTTLVMYIGEMILLSGNLYRFGDGWWSAGLGGLVLAPVDLLIVIASGVVTALICFGIGCTTNHTTQRLSE